MQKLTKTLIVINLIISIFLFVISYGYVDQTLISIVSPSHPSITKLSPLIKLIADNRHPFAFAWLGCIIAIFLSQILFLLNPPKIKKTKSNLFIVLITVLLFSLSFPYLSKDIFSYIFNSRILLHYRQNPYQVSPDQFSQQDLWVNLCHWVDHPYAYGPVMLIINSIIMAVIGVNRLVANFYAIKFLHLVLFLASAYLLYKKDKKGIWAIWLYNPLLLVELLQNSHNDLIMISLFVFSFCLKFNNKITKYLGYILSVLTKSFSIVFLPAILFPKKTILKLSFLIALLIIYFRGVHAWYYSWLYMIIPFAHLKKPTLILMFSFNFFLIIGNYFGFLYFSGWASYKPFAIINLVKPLLILGIIMLELPPLVRLTVKTIKKLPQS